MLGYIYVYKLVAETGDFKASMKKKNTKQPLTILYVAQQLYNALNYVCFGSSSSMLIVFSSCFVWNGERCLFLYVYQKENQVYIFVFCIKKIKAIFECNRYECF